jgi:hypothetical protein
MRTINESTRFRRDFRREKRGIHARWVARLGSHSELGL